MPDPIKQLEAQLIGALDELDRLNRDGDLSKIATGAELCAQEARVWYLQESLALRRADVKLALACHRAAMEAEQRRLAAIKEVAADSYATILKMLQDEAAMSEELANEIPDGDLPDFDPNDEWDDHL